MHTNRHKIDKNPKLLIKLNQESVKKLSNIELRHMFQSIDRACGLLSETTRSVHEGLMAKLLLENLNRGVLFAHSFEETRLGWFVASKAPAVHIESNSRPQF